MQKMAGLITRISKRRAYQQIINGEEVVEAVAAADQKQSLLNTDNILRKNQGQFYSNCKLITVVTSIVILFTLFFVVINNNDNNNSIFESKQDGDSNGKGALLLAADENPSTNPEQGSQRGQRLIVNIRQGALEGKKLRTRDGRDYLAFLGIPYAKPPVKELRFKPPQPITEGWSGIRNATTFASECTQDGRQGGWRGIKGNEDCLYLNVYTPKTIEDLSAIGNSSSSNEFRRRLPIMVYFHGGGLAGNIFYNGGEYLLDEDIILVTLHFRVGVFGSINVHTPQASGNQGLKDQVMALKWIQSNIIQFGGDPTKVLLFGESSGAASSTAHLVSPMSKGLFSRIIAESGTILQPVWSLNPIQDAFNLGNKLNCTITNSTTNNEIATTTSDKAALDELMECLMSAEAESLVITTAQSATEGCFQYSVEYFTNPDDDEQQASAGAGEEKFFTDTALKLYQNPATINLVPVIFGFNNQEGIQQSLPYLKIPQLLDAMNQNWTAHAGSTLYLVTNPNNFTVDPTLILDRIHEFYFHGSNVSVVETGQNLTDMYSDRGYLHPNYMNAYYLLKAYQEQEQQQEEQQPPNVYLYYLNEQVPQSFWVDVFSGTMHIANVTINDVKGAGHVDELQYLFPNAGYNYPEIPVGAPQYHFSKMLIHLWTTFADTGVPDTKTKEFEGMQEWLPLSLSNPTPYKWYQIHDKDSKMIDYLNERFQFWNSFNTTDLYF